MQHWTGTSVQGGLERGEPQSLGTITIFNRKFPCAVFYGLRNREFPNCIGDTSSVKTAVVNAWYRAQLLYQRIRLHRKLYMLSRPYKIKIYVLITKHLAPQNHRVPGYLSEPFLPVGCYMVLSYLLSTWYLSKYRLNISRTQMIEEKLISTPEMAAQNGLGDINFSGRVILAGLYSNV